MVVIVLLVVVGPCLSTVNSREYAQRLAPIRERGRINEVVMRVYFEKPRTTVGWKVDQ